MRECKQNEITIQKFHDFTHTYTERIAVHVVTGGIEAAQDKVREFFLTEDLAEDMPRIQKYYANVPVWNLHVRFQQFVSREGATNNHTKIHGCNAVEAILVANCYYADIREAFLREKDDIRKQRRKNRRKKV